LFQTEARESIVSAKQRKFFINNQLLALFLTYLAFSIFVAFLFLGWEVFSADFHYIVNGSDAPDDYDMPMLIKLGSFIIWGLASFTFAYAYLDTKFKGIFLRMDGMFKAMIKDDKVSLKFRKGDPFTPIEESFEHMKSTLLGRIETRKKLIKEINEAIENVPTNLPPEKVKELQAKIDRELTL